MDGSYRMRLQAPGERLSVQMALHQGDRRVFAASLTARRRPISNATVARMLVRHPLMTARVTSLIHLQGVRLALRGVARVPRPPHPPQEHVG